MKNELYKFPDPQLQEHDFKQQEIYKDRVPACAVTTEFVDSIFNRDVIQQTSRMVQKH